MGFLWVDYDLLQSHQGDLRVNPRGFKFGVECVGFTTSSCCFLVV